MEGRQIISKYTHLFTVQNQGDTEYIVYNSRNNSFFKISEELYIVLQEYSKDPQYYIG